MFRGGGYVRKPCALNIGLLSVFKRALGGLCIGGGCYSTCLCDSCYPFLANSYGTHSVLCLVVFLNTF